MGNLARLDTRFCPRLHNYYGIPDDGRSALVEIVSQYEASEWEIMLDGIAAFTLVQAETVVSDGRARVVRLQIKLPLEAGDEHDPLQAINEAVNYDCDIMSYVTASSLSTARTSGTTLF